MSDHRYFVMKAAASNIKDWNGGKRQNPIANFFFTSSSLKAVASTLTAPPAKRLKLPDTGSASSIGPAQSVINVDELGVRLYIECVCAKFVDELGASVHINIYIYIYIYIYIDMDVH